MTIAAGFRFNSGVLLCADSEETTADLVKVSVPKIEVFNKQYSKLVLTGAGDSDLLNRAFEEIEGSIPARVTDTAIRWTVEKVVRRLYAEYVYPHPGDDKPMFELLVGFQRGGEADFVKMSRTALVRPKLYQVIGYGVPHAAHLLDRLARDGMTEAQTVVLAVYVLQQTKRYVPYCGGTSRICLLRHDGQVDWVPRRAIGIYERYNDSFDEAVRGAFFGCADGSQSLDGFDRVVNDTAVQLSALHHQIVEMRPLSSYHTEAQPSTRPRRMRAQSMVERLEAAQAPKAPKHGRKALPPSRG